MRQYDRIIFVARSGTCREPMAAGILQDFMLKKEIEVLARGLVVSFPEPLNRKVEAVLISNGITLKDFSSICTSAEKEAVVYGRLPLMTVQNCVVKSALDNCGCKDDYYLLKDRKGICFPVIANRGACTNTIYNSLPMYMADKLDGAKADVARFIFTIETAEEISAIYRMYKNKEKPNFDFTRGHYFRGV